VAEAATAWHDLSVVWTITRPLLGPPGVETTAAADRLVARLGFGYQSDGTLAVTRGIDDADLDRTAA
jgi:hypothetical protein